MPFVYTVVIEFKVLYSLYYKRGTVYAVTKYYYYNSSSLIIIKYNAFNTFQYLIWYSRTFEQAFS
jgi:hypothetical protein